MFSKNTKYNFKLKTAFLLLFSLCLQFSVLAQNPTWKPAPFEVINKYKTFKTTQYAHVFSGSKHNIVRLAPELEGLTAIELPLDKYKKAINGALQLKFK